MFFLNEIALGNDSRLWFNIRSALMTQSYIYICTHTRTQICGSIFLLPSLFQQNGENRMYRQIHIHTNSQTPNSSLWQIQHLDRIAAVMSDPTISPLPSIQEFHAMIKTRWEVRFIIIISHHPEWTGFAEQEEMCRILEMESWILLMEHIFTNNVMQCKGEFNPDLADTLCIFFTLY